MQGDEAKATTTSRSKRIRAVVFLILLVVFTVYLLWDYTLGDYLRSAALLAVALLLVLLGYYFPRVGRTLMFLAGAYLLFVYWMILTLGPMILFVLLSQFILQNVAVRFQIVVFVAWAILLGWAVLLIATERKRERLFNRLKRIGAFAPVAYSFNLLMIAVMFFSSVTYILAEHGVLKLNRAADASILPWDITLFYFWHFLEAVPLLRVNETLHWNEPLTYDSGWVGLMLLLFKLAVIVPVIGAFAWYWRKVGAQKPSSAQGLLKVIGAARSMKVVIAGGTGQVGTILARAFHRQGHQVVVLSRSPETAPWRVVKWDAESPGDWRAVLEGADAVINLAGRSVNCRYNAENRRLITESRVKSTQVIGEAIALAARPPRVWLQASTATIYAHTYDKANDEASGVIGCSEDAPDTWRFSNDVVTSWEQAANEANTPRTRRVLLRSAIIMSPDRGGAFDMLLKLVRFRLGGSAGDGEQYVSWIHDQDFIRSIFWLIDHDEVEGPVNLAAPNPLPNSEFMQALRAAWGTRFGLDRKSVV